MEKVPTDCQKCPVLQSGVQKLAGEKTKVETLIQIKLDYLDSLENIDAQSREDLKAWLERLQDYAALAEEWEWTDWLEELKEEISQSETDLENPRNMYADLFKSKEDDNIVAEIEKISQKIDDLSRFLTDLHESCAARRQYAKEHPVRFALRSLLRVSDNLEECKAPNSWSKREEFYQQTGMWVSSLHNDAAAQNSFTAVEDG